MTFLELSLENVGAFKGRHTLNLLPVEGRSLILIGALNGSGKTTLLNAFQLALYGKESHGVRGANTYQKHLRQLINSGAAPTDGASLELTVDLSQETGRGPITVQRRWCTTLKRGKRSVAVHHREPGNNDPAKMLTLCLSCHAKVTRTLYLQDDWPEFLRVLWREQHPEGHEHLTLDFAVAIPQARNVLLFKEMGEPPALKRVRRRQL